MIDTTKLKPKKGPTKYIPIVAEDGLYLYDPGIVKGSVRLQTPPRIARKFIRCFQNTWKQLPEQDRRTLTDFWRPRRAVEGDSYPVPLIMFNSLRLSARHIAECLQGHEFMFDVFYLDRKKPTGIVNVIAHELGHAISYAHDWGRQHKCKAYGGNDCVACECQAWSYMAAWGFDPFDGLLPKHKCVWNRFGRR